MLWVISSLHLLKLANANLIFLVMILVHTQDPCLILYSETYITQIAIIYLMLLCSFGPKRLMDQWHYS